MTFVGRIFDRARTTLARLALYGHLWRYARQIGLNVAVCTSPITHPIVSNQHARRGGEYAGAYGSVERVVYLAPDHFLNPYTLAHEIAHHLLRRTRYKSDEEATDDVAARLCAFLAPGLMGVLAEEAAGQIPMLGNVKVEQMDGKWALRRGGKRSVFEVQAVSAKRGDRE